MLADYKIILLHKERNNKVEVFIDNFIIFTSLYNSVRNILLQITDVQMTLFEQKLHMRKHRNSIVK